MCNTTSHSHLLASVHIVTTNRNPIHDVRKTPRRQLKQGKLSLSSFVMLGRTLFTLVHVLQFNKIQKNEVWDVWQITKCGYMRNDNYKKYAPEHYRKLLQNQMCRRYAAILMLIHIFWTLTQRTNYRKLNNFVNVHYCAYEHIKAERNGYDIREIAQLRRFATIVANK